MKDRRLLVDEMRPVEGAASALVLLASWAEPRLAEMENGLRAAGVQPLRIPRQPPRGDAGSALRFAREELDACSGDAVRFDGLVIQLLRDLDRRLYDAFPGLIDGGVHRGFDGRPRHLLRRAGFLTRTLAGDGRGNDAETVPKENLGKDQTGRFDLIRGAPAQPPSLGSHLKWFTVLDPRDLEPYRLLWRGRSQSSGRVPGWENSYLHARLDEEGTRLAIVLWPLETGIQYASLKPDWPSARPGLLRVCEPQNDAEVQEEILQALEFAANRMATVLVLPELVVSPATLETVKTRLKKNGVDGYPILTLLGLSHREGTEGCVNEAVLLGPGGEELHRHRKMSCFTHGSAGQEAGEDNQTGFDLIVLESAIGTISTPICLDLFQEDVAAARSRLPVDLLLVPSLSDTTSAHLAQAKLAAASVHRTSTFVCNRRLLTQPTRERPEGSSFFLLPVTRSREGGPLQEKGDRQSPGHPNGKNHPKPGEVHHHPAHSDKPALVFSLIDLLGP